MASLSVLLVDLIPFYGFQGELDKSKIEKLKQPLLRLKKVSHHLEGRVGKSENPLFNSGAKFHSNETNRALAAIEKGARSTHNLHFFY